MICSLLKTDLSYKVVTLSVASSNSPTFSLPIIGVPGCDRLWAADQLVWPRCAMTVSS